MKLSHEVITLSAGLKDDLDWSKEISRAEESEAILWELDLQCKKIHRNDTATFFAHSRALQEFVKQCYTPHAQRTLGVCLYRGALDLFDRQEWEEPFQEWLVELREKSYAGHELRGVATETMERHYFELFCAQIFAEYFHRLISVLPEDLSAFVLLDGEYSPAFAAQLFSKERFEHFSVGMVKVEEELPALGIYLPSDPFCDRKILEQLDEVMRSLEEPYRILCEEKLTEEWNGLDRLIVIPESVSVQGKRKLQGFMAAGGEIF